MLAGLASAIQIQQLGNQPLDAQRLLSRLYQPATLAA
jgi:hypothetical protein